MTILIVEDNLIFSSKLEIILDELGYHSAGPASNGKEALALFNAHKPDLVLMDIHLKGEMNGIEVAEKIQSTTPTPVIFITSFTDQQTFDRAKATAPFAYLVKPFEKDELSRAIELSMVNLHQPEVPDFPENSALLAPSHLFVKERNKLVRLQQNDIEWIEAEDKYCTLYTRSRKFVLRKSLKELLVKLDPQLFTRSHKSFVVNTSAIEDIDLTLHIIRINNREIPLGSTYKDDLIRRLPTL